MTRTAHPPYDTETMLRILRYDRELPRTTRVEFRGIKPMNGIKTPGTRAVPNKRKAPTAFTVEASEPSYSPRCALRWGAFDF